MEYLDFDIRLEMRTGMEFNVVVLNSPAGNIQATSILPYSEYELKSLLTQVENALLRSTSGIRVILSKEEQIIQEVGHKLFEALFIREVYALYKSSLDIAKRENKGIRIKLRIGEPFLAALPWEYLYDPYQKEYLSLDHVSSIVRYFEYANPSLPIEITSPVQILGLIANPKDQRWLDAEGERRRMEASLEPLIKNGLVTLEWTEKGTRTSLLDKIQEKKWHIFHYVGHGAFNESKDIGFLAFEDDEHRTDPIYPRNLARLLGSCNTLTLAVLNGCEGARQSQIDLDSSIATVLVRKIPAVVAMQYPITDKSAQYFSQRFYKALSQGKNIEQALYDGRDELIQTHPQSLEWGIPVLYSRSNDGKLFKLTLNSESKKETGLIYRLHTDYTTLNYKTQIKQAVLEENWDETIFFGEALRSMLQIDESTRESLANAYLQRSIIKRLKKDFVFAISDATGAINIDSKNGAYYFARGIAYYEAEINRSAVGDFSKSINDLTIALEIETRNQEYYYCRGLVNYYSKNYKDAISDLQVAINIDPEEARYHMMCGQIYFDLAEMAPKNINYTNAITYYSKSISLNPNNAETYYLRGLTYQRSMNKKNLKLNYTMALEDFARAIVLNSKQAKYYYHRAKTHLHTLNYGGKIVSYSSIVSDLSYAINMDSNNSEYYYYRGKVYFDAFTNKDYIGSYSKAIADLTKAIEINPKSSLYYFERGEIYHHAAVSDSKEGSFSNAIKDKTFAIALNPNNSEYYYKRGVSYHIAAQKGSKDGSYHKSLRDKTQAIRLNPNKGIYYYSRGLTYNLLKLNDKAQKDFKKAVKLGYAKASSKITQ